MDRKGPEVNSTFNQDAEPLQDLVDFKTEKCEEDIFIPSSFERENVDELDSMVAMMVADIAKNEESFPPPPPPPPRAEVPTYYSTNNSWIYDAFQPMEGIEFGSKDQSDQSFNISSSDSSQLDPAFVQCRQLSVDGNQRYDPESTLAGSGALVPFKSCFIQSNDPMNEGIAVAAGDMSAYDICAPSTSQSMSFAMASTSRSQSSPQQLGAQLGASSKRELRLIKNRQAAKESRRRKKEFVKQLEAHVSMLQLQNKTLREELNYLKTVSKDKQ